MEMRFFYAATCAQCVQGEAAMHVRRPHPAQACGPFKRNHQCLVAQNLQPSHQKDFHKKCGNPSLNHCVGAEVFKIREVCLGSTWLTLIRTRRGVTLNSDERATLDMRCETLQDNDTISSGKCTTTVQINGHNKRCHISSADCWFFGDLLRTCTQQQRPRRVVLPLPCTCLTHLPQGKNDSRVQPLAGQWVTPPSHLAEAV
eukprot:5065337-Amphidinium_carterae.1